MKIVVLLVAKKVVVQNVWVDVLLDVVETVKMGAENNVPADASEVVAVVVVQHAALTALLSALQDVPKIVPWDALLHALTDAKGHVKIHAKGHAVTIVIIPVPEHAVGRAV